MRKQKRFDIHRNIGGPSTEEKIWLRNNKIRRYSMFTKTNGDRYISFAYEEDAMAYKLRWMF